MCLKSVDRTANSADLDQGSVSRGSILFAWDISVQLFRLNKVGKKLVSISVQLFRVSKVGYELVCLIFKIKPDLLISAVHQQEVKNEIKNTWRS